MPKNKINELYKLARTGDINALNMIFNNHYRLVKNKAKYVYDNIINNVSVYYNLNDVELFNSLIDYDDILQIVSIKVYEVIKKYFSTNSTVYLSIYISHMIKAFLNNLIVKNVNDIINTKDNFINQEINFQFREYDEDKLIISDIMNVVKDNRNFSKHYNFICDTFSGYSDSELALKHQLHPRGLSVKRNLIAKQYNNYLKNQFSLYNYVTDGQMLNDLKYGDIYSMPFYKMDIIYILHDIYMELKKYYYVEYNSIKREFLDLLYVSINNHKQFLYKESNIDDFMNNVLISMKNSYLKNKMLELNYIKFGNWNKYIMDNRTIDSNQVLDLIKNNKISLIYPFSEYINMYIEEIYIKVNSFMYVEKRSIKSDIRRFVNSLINNYFKNYEHNLIKFNNYFKKQLYLKKKLYLESKEVKKDSVLVKKLI